MTPAGAGAGWEQALETMTLVLVRVSGLMVFAPVFSSEAIPMRIKAGFVLAVSLLVAPVVAAFPGAHAELGILPVLGELSVGLVFGLTLSFVFEALQFTGQVLGFQFSFSLVNVMDPNSPVSIPLMGQLFGLLGTLTVLGAGLHRTMLAALLRTFATAPVGAVTLDPRAGWALVTMAGGIFAAALQLSAPVLAATLLAELAVALAETSGLLNLAFPAVASNTILRRLAGERSRGHRHSEETRRRMRELAGECRTPTALYLPTVRVAAGSLGELQPGAVLRFELPASRTAAQFRAGGVTLFRSTPVGQADHRAAQLLALHEAKP